MNGEKISIVVVGLQFGAAFIKLYQNHPNVREVAICDVDPNQLQVMGDHFGIQRRFASLEDALAAPDIDAVHLITPLKLHAAQSVQVLDAGKHCACAVVMGRSMDEVNMVVEAQRRSGMNYMMMETMVYHRGYLLAKEMHDNGEFGDLTFLRGIYFQDVDGHRVDMRAVAPMHYSTHALAPLLALVGKNAVSVNCLGSGILSPRIQQPGGNPFRLESALFRLDGLDIAAEVTRSWFETARSYVEGIQIYGVKRSLEWGICDHDQPLVFTMGDEPKPGGRHVEYEEIQMPDFANRLPKSLRGFTEYEHNGAHGGSHPHLVHEFVTSIVEGRKPAIDAATAANWTAPGFCAHDSALKYGERIDIPQYV